MTPARHVRDADLIALARTLYGEARGEGREGLVAVAHVVLNRVRQGGRYGRTVAEACLAPWQFSCWNRNSPGRERLAELSIETDAEPPAFLRCLAVAASCLAGAEPDPTGGADHYHLAGTHASWAAAMVGTAAIGRHRFYKAAD